MTTLHDAFMKIYVSLRGTKELLDGDLTADGDLAVTNVAYSRRAR